MTDFYKILGEPRTASRDQVNDAFRKIAVQYHPDRNKDEDASRRFAEASEAYAVLSDDAKRHLYDVLGPEKYDDPREVIFYRLNQEAGRREDQREYNTHSSAMQYDAAYSTGILVFFLLVLRLFHPFVGPRPVVLRVQLLPDPSNNGRRSRFLQMS
ncbi:MAG: DnaJ domain-containing protein [Nitrososphaerota archaeon]|nr:DnaJ domain-containing protein [Nitrososphaerota archaeon]MDG7023957.1 DnaJ domain-containing protein [Nitrososphaerota archaeon]